MRIPTNPRMIKLEREKEEWEDDLKIKYPIKENKQINQTLYFEKRRMKKWHERWKRERGDYKKNHFFFFCFKNLKCEEWKKRERTMTYKTHQIDDILRHRW